jgi:hypothetical protein
LSNEFKDVDRRDKPGHDGLGSLDTPEVSLYNRAP